MIFKSDAIEIKFQRTKSSGFVKFMKGEDRNHADGGLNSIVNGFIYLRNSSNEELTPETIYDRIKYRYAHNFVNKECFKKCFYLIENCMGHYYWSNNNHLTVDDYIK